MEEHSWNEHLDFFFLRWEDEEETEVPVEAEAVTSLVLIKITVVSLQDIPQSDNKPFEESNFAPLKISLKSSGKTECEGHPAVAAALKSSTVAFSSTVTT